MVKKIGFLGILILSVPAAEAQEVSSVMEQILVISIDARVNSHEGESIWSVEHSTLTVPGRSVQLKLEGTNILIYANLTPYLQNSGEVLLFAQGEIWINDMVHAEKRYFSGMDSVPVKIGEKVLFFPLGVTTDEMEQDINLEIEIGVDLYTNLQKKSTKR